MIRVLLVDDHPAIREGLKRITEKTTDLRVTAEAGNAPEALESIRKSGCDVVLMDISLPGRGGLELLKEIKGEWPKLPVLVLSVHAEDQYGLRALMAGAAGYLCKDAAPDQLIQAIRKVHSGGRYISPELGELLAMEIDGDITKPPHRTLSNREFRVLCMIASGLSLTEIANQLSLSVKTVSTHRTRLLAKMKMKNNSELTRYALKQGLVD
ncbi:MAG TPA: response regulator transcription factor [Acidobacteriota bacterium]